MRAQASVVTAASSSYKGGPSFANNGGNELKFQIAFVHSGIEGGQPQGSYFVWVEKDGQKLPVSDGVRSIALQAQQGPQGKYNYEYKIGRDQLPGNTVAGTYQIWVLDGNGERDSQTFSFTVPDGQGEVWIASSTRRKTYRITTENVGAQGPPDLVPLPYYP